MKNRVPAPQVTRREPSPALGLTSEEVAVRLQRGLVNTPVKRVQKSAAQILVSNVFTYFNLLFFFLAFCLVFAGSGVENLLFLGVVVFNTAISTVQELRAKRLLDRLTLVSSPRSRVIRNGKEHEVRAEDLVADDIVLFSSGNQIPADAVVVEGEVTMNEALVTGEADEIEKKRGDALISGSFVISGHCRARLTDVGSESFISRLTLAAKRHKKQEKPGMMRALSVLVRIIGVLALPLGAALFFQSRMGGESLLSATDESVSLVCGMIPQGLYLLASAALALAVIRLGRRGVLSHNLGCVEALARVDVLCLDKTGTITDDKMTFRDLIPTEGQDKEKVLTSLGSFAAASDADNTTILALRAAFVQSDAPAVVKKIPFSSRHKFSALSFGARGSFVLGAPEKRLGDAFSPDEIRPYTQNGMRVLVFGACTIQTDEVTGQNVPRDVKPLGYVLLENHVRESARETFRYFSEQGVSIKVISGDNPESVSAACKSAGITGAERFIDASSLSDAQLAAAAETYTVFGRVTPEQKRTLVLALKQAGHTVAMTGDGVNDVLALKEADCSVAMASGSDVAAAVSQIVLLNNDFSAMPSVVGEGRQVVGNIERTASLYLVKNVFSFCTSLLLLFLPFLKYPIQNVQLTLLSSLTIGIPSFFLALEPNRERISGSFLKNVILRALPAGLCDFSLIVAVLFLAPRLALSDAETATVLALLLCLVGLLMHFYLARPMNRLRALLIGALLLALVGAVFVLPDVFRFVLPSKAALLLALPLTAAAPAVFTLFAALVSRATKH